MFRALVLIVSSLVPILAVVADAATPVPWTKQAFADAQKAGEPIVVFVHASW
jgi:hypothetical protein